MKCEVCGAKGTPESPILCFDYTKQRMIGGRMVHLNGIFRHARCKRCHSMWCERARITADEERMRTQREHRCHHAE